MPKSSLDVTSACTSVLRALTVRDDRIRLMHRSCAYAVRHVRLTCAAMDIAESSCTHRSRMLVDAMMLHPHTSMQSGGGCGMRLFGAANTLYPVNAMTPENSLAHESTQYPTCVPTGIHIKCYRLDIVE